MLAAWLLLAGAATPALGETADAPPTIREIRFEGPGTPHRPGMRSIVAELAGNPLATDALVAVVRRLETVPAIGGVDVEAVPDGAFVDLVFRYDGRPLRLGRMDFAWGPDAPADPEGSWAFHRRLEAASGDLALVVGEAFHPFLRAVDVETVRAYFLDRGHREVRVEVEETVAEGLVTLVMRIHEGPRFVADGVTLRGSTLDARARRRLLATLRTRADAPVSPTGLEADRERVSEEQCLLGHARARVDVEEVAVPAAPGSAEPERRLGVTFVVVPGPRVRTERVQVVGRYVPWGLVASLRLREGAPFCPTRLEEARAQIADHLRDHGFPDPDVAVRTRERLTRAGGRRIAVTFTIRNPGDVRIERIWLRGNRVTREDVVHQLLAVREGQLYRQSEVDASVQALRRSGLFRRADAQIVAGSSPDHVYLYFVLVEREMIGIDVAEQRLTLRNMDVTAWPGDDEALAQGRAFRGAGQRLDLYAQPGRQGIEWTHEFAHRHLTAEAGVNRRTSGTAGHEETWYTAGAGLGPKLLEGRLALIPFGELEWTRSEQRGAEGLPVLDGDALTLAAGLDARLDLNRRDEERIPFLGFDASARLRAGRAVLDEDFRWTDHRTRGRVHLPLYRTRRGQHFVLRLRAELSQVFADATGRLQAHQRIVPQARGYGSDAISLRFPVNEFQTVRLGGLHAAEGTVEVRLPVPWGRRNAFSPFLDAATVGESTTDLTRDPRLGAGLAYAFSFLDERLEGVLWAAYALHAQADPTYVGARVGGSF